MSARDVIANVRSAAALSGRAAEELTLIAASKLQPSYKLRAALEDGISNFGENYVQEASVKWSMLLEEFGPLVKLAMIGPLQTNKVKQAVGLFSSIHSLDRVSLAKKLADFAQLRGNSPELFVQVNVGNEPQKAGVLPKDLDSFLGSCHSMDLRPIGLMCIPPERSNPSQYFNALKIMAERNGLTSLSMGMSNDYRVAIAHGATHLRVGSAIFGERKTISHGI